MKFSKLTISRKEDLIFGFTPNPVKTSRGLVIGNGRVYPEVNFTLPPMMINDHTFASIKEQYRNIVRDILERALDLHSAGIIFEFETLIEMTKKPDYGVELVKVMNEECENYFSRHALKSEIRLTPNDLREFDRPPKQRTSAYLDLMMELFERGAREGGDMLSIESTGGKEIFDDALMMCNTREVVFALCVLGVRDMQMLWKKICGVAASTGRIPGGDTACGFANTAMVLADKKYIPKVFAAVVRILSVVRTLVAIEEGAKGPDKDCGYEGVFLKAIAGIPISMEGKTAACAHLSSVGNIAGACADLWSNESVQNIKLLADMAPTVYYEQLEYDTRLFNQAIKGGKEAIHAYQDLLVKSDRDLDPQAFILDPGNVILISEAIVSGRSYLEGAVKGALKGIELIREAIRSGQLLSTDMENSWLETIHGELESIPMDESQFIGEMMETVDRSRFISSEYGL